MDVVSGMLKSDENDKAINLSEKRDWIGLTNFFDINISFDRNSELAYFRLKRRLK